MVEIFQLFIKASILGLSTGLFCTSTCLPLLLPVLLSRSKSTMRKGNIALLQFFVGRFVSYLLVGLISGILGLYLTESDIYQEIIIPIIYLIIGVLMIIYGVSGLLVHVKTCTKIDKKFQKPGYLFLLGFLMGLNICPPFLLAIGAASNLGDVLKSMFFFTVFFVATSVYFIPLIFTGFAARVHKLQKLARYFSVAAGIYFIYVAVRIILMLTGIIEPNY
jgi:sulfite exporter TauE/SafE